MNGRRRLARQAHLCRVSTESVSLFLFSVTIAAPPKTHHQNENRRLAGGANAVRQEIEVDELPRIAYYYQKSQSFAESYPVF